MRDAGDELAAVALVLAELRDVLKQHQPATGRIQRDGAHEEVTTVMTDRDLLRGRLGVEEALCDVRDRDRLRRTAPDGIRSDRDDIADSWVDDPQQAIGISGHHAVGAALNQQRRQLLLEAARHVEKLRNR